MTALDDALWPRAALPRRPMLGAVLAHLTDTDADLWRPHPSGVIVASASHVRGAWVPSGMPFITSRAWVTTNVAEAYELLQARDLVPMGYVGRFVCEACGGRGSTSVETPEGYGYAPRCLDCVGAGHRPHPPTVAALASWASLGFAAGDDAPDDTLTIPRAEALAGDEEFAGAVFSHAPPVWWRVYPPGADASRAYPEGTARRALCDAGLGFRRMSTHTMLYVPPLGLVTP